MPLGGAESGSGAKGTEMVVTVGTAWADTPVVVAESSTARMAARAARGLQRSMLALLAFITYRFERTLQACKQREASVGKIDACRRIMTSAALQARRHARQRA